MKNKSADWGQKVPEKLLERIHILQQYNVTLLPHHLLLHPAFGNQSQFGNANRKGPMFPPYDLRITGKVNYDDMITKEEFWEVVKQTLENMIIVALRTLKIRVLNSVMRVKIKDGLLDICVIWIILIIY